MMHEAADRHPEVEDEEEGDPVVSSVMRAELKFRSGMLFRTPRLSL